MEIKAVLLKNKTFNIIKIDDSLESLQKCVGGYIESVPLNDVLSGANIVAYCNEEGKLLRLNAEALFVQKDGAVVDMICGPIIFTGVTDEGDSASLTDEQIALIRKEFNQEVYIAQTGDSLEHVLMPVMKI